MEVHRNEPEGRRIALFLPDYLDYVHRLVDGVVEWQRAQHGFHVKDYRFKFGDLDDPSKLVGPPPWTGHADGVIAYVGPQPGVGEWLKRGEVPVVNTSADRAADEVPAVHGDGRSVADLSCEHALELGYRSFLYVGYDLSPGSVYRERHFAAALYDRGYEMTSCRVLARLDGSAHQAARMLGGDPRLHSFLLKLPKPLAVFCQSDHYGAGVCAACQQVELNVPEDVAVLGVADTGVARDSEPPLSSVRLPAERIGSQAMALLDRLMRGEQPPGEPLEIPATEIVVRASTSLEMPRDADIGRAMQMIRDRACDGIDVGDVLQTLDMSRKTFERRFFDAIGRPPGEEIRRIRLARAEELLATTGLSVTRIGRMVGFHRPSMFARFFKMRSGRTPRAYRRASMMMDSEPAETQPRQRTAILETAIG
ncbi:MAG: substrate-binding domain-containing protein [Planctomycetaceae bacterium]